MIYYTCTQNLATLASAVPEIWLRALKLKMGHSDDHASLKDGLSSKSYHLIESTCAKFDESSFGRSRDIIGALTTLIYGWFAIYGLTLAMVNLSAKFEVSISTHYKDMKGDTKCRKWGGWGSWVSLKVSGISGILQST